MKSSSKFSVLLFSILLPFVYLLPVITSPLSSDDLHNFEIRISSKENSSKNIFELANGAIAYYRDCGRFTPLAEFSKEFAFKCFQTVLAYKIFLYFLNLFSVAAFTLLLYSIGKKNLIPFFIVAYGTVVQFRVQFHDPFTSLHGMYLLLGICIFLSAALYVLFLKSRNYFLLALSLLFFNSAILISEIGLVLVPLLFICSFFSNTSPKKVLLLSSPFIFCCCAYLIYVWHIRSSITQSYEGVQTNFAIPAMLDVLAKQVFSAFPFSNLYRQVAIPQILAAQLTPLNVIAILFVALLSVGIVALHVKSRKNSFNFSLPLVGLGVALMVLPACLIMQSVKYQQTLCYGFGYLPVYIQNFGTATLLAYLLSLFPLTKPVKSNFILATLLFIICTGSVTAFLFNNAICKTRAYEQSLPFEAQIKSVKNGILSSLADKSTIILAPDYIWRAPQIYHTIFKNYTGKDFNVYDIEDWDTLNPPCYIFSCPKGDTIYTRLYSMDCLNGKQLNVLKTDTFLHNVRLSEIEKPLLVRHCE